MVEIGFSWFLKCVFMRKNVLVFLWVVMIVAFASCKKDDPTVLEISSENISIDSVGGVARVEVTSNKAWEAIALVDWISLSQTTDKGNGELIVTASNMVSDADREATVTIKTSNGVMKQILVQQSPRIKKSGLADITLYISGITSASVKCRMSVVNDYGNEVTEQGFCWSTKAIPTIEDDFISVEDTVAVIAGLTENTKYYVRSYAKNSKGVSYGRQLEFITKAISKADGRIAKGFLVCDTVQVYFSSGNVQYRPTENSWRFAEKQSDMIGIRNSQASAEYDGWIDLFGWGTSGYGVAPYATSPTYSLYGDGDKNISSTNYDWGVYNGFAGGTSGMWRTMTNAEWSYLLYNRPNASLLRGLAMVEGVAGMVILPDTWTLPEECAFNEKATTYSDNSYSTFEWLLMQGNGAVFLPAGGNRYGTNVIGGGTEGYYWSATSAGEYTAYSISFTEKSVTGDRSYRIYGRSVRLVQNLQ